MDLIRTIGNEQLEEFAMECIPARKRPLRYAPYATLCDWAIVQALANQLDKVRATRPKSYILRDGDHVEYCHLTRDCWVITGPVPADILEDATQIYCSQIHWQIPPEMVLERLQKRAFQLLRMHEGPGSTLPIPC